MASENQEIAIRQASMEDRAELLPLIIASQIYQKQELEGEDILQKEQFEVGIKENFEKWIGDTDKYYFVAINEEGTLVGYVFCMVDRVVANDVSLSDLYVLPEYRQLGIGTKLTQYAIDWSHAQKVNEIVLAVSRHNQAALAVYQSLGFIEHQDDYLYLKKDL